MLNAADLPQDLDAHRFLVQWYGQDECIVEQHRGILCFDSEMLRFATEQGTLSVEGQDLGLEVLTDSRAKIKGQIISLSIEAKS